MNSPQRQRQSNQASRLPEPVQTGGSSAQAQPINFDAEPRLALERIGEILKRERERRGEELQPIADYLCIRKSYLVALENSRYDELPADAYVIGFLRSYAEYLGLDGKDAIDRYRNEMAGRRRKPMLTIPAPITEGRTPSGVVMVSAAVFALFIYIVWDGFSTSDRAAVNVPPALPAPQAEIVLPAPEPTLVAPQAAETKAPATAAAAPSPEPAPTPTPTPSLPVPENVVVPAPTTAQVYGKAGPSRITIKADQSSWLQIKNDDDEVIFDKVLKPGDSYRVPAGADYTMTTGNGAGIAIILNGAELPRLSRTSRVMRDIPLDEDHLKSLPSND